MKQLFKHDRPAFVLLSTALLLSACEGDSRPFEESVEVASRGFTAIQITPPANAQPEIFINSGESRQIGIVGIAGEDQVPVVIDARNRNFRSSNPSAVSVTEDGLISGAEVGGNVAAAEISVVLGGFVSDSLMVNVRNAALGSIMSIGGSDTLEACIPADYHAVGAFDDNSARTLYEGVDFEIAVGSATVTEAVAGVSSVNATGLGSVTLSVQAGGFELSRDIQVLQNLQSISITPNALVVASGQNLELSAVGTYLLADGSGGTVGVDITDNVTWEIIEGTNSARVGNTAGNKGVLTGVSVGMASVQASCGTVAQSAAEEVTVRVDDSDVLSFEITRPDGVIVVSTDDFDADDPFELAVARGSEYDATRDVTDDVTFSARNLNGVEAIDLTAILDGEVVPLMAGSAEVTASLTDSDGDEIAFRTITVRVLD